MPVYGRTIANKWRMEIIVCTMIDVEEVSIDLLERCMMQYVQIVDRRPRSLSSLHRIDQYTAENASRREGRTDIDPIKYRSLI
ncbi:MAG: hypothetical protein U9R75_08970 [Candidatus Thermoplasmatota archaeon]|nr:hypothetical protein [Candidatus Thermoplasmatota archaeon]